MATPKYPRILRAKISYDLGIYPVVAVLGARQVGKSTLCREIAEEYGLSVCTLDDADYLRKAVETPEGLLDELGPNAFIDEAQRAPGLFLALKAVVDRDQQAGAYLLSGSNQPAMSATIGDSLLGRAAYRTLRPLTLSELRFDESHPGWSFLFGDDDDAVLQELGSRADASGELDWRDAARTGGFPRALAAPENYRVQILNDYIDTYVNRDVREVIGVESPQRFEQFFRLVCARTGQELNASAISHDLGTSVNTVRRWVDALKRSFLLEIIQPYSRNAGQRVIKAPKLFLTDPALALSGAREIEPTGFHLETLICTDLLQWREEDPNRAIYHWRLASGQEVDFVLQQDSQLIPLEIKASAKLKAGHGKHIRAFRERNPNSPRGVILSCDPTIRQFGDGIIAAPWWGVI